MFREMIQGKFDGSDKVDNIELEKFKNYFVSMQSAVEGAITREDLCTSFL